MTRYQIYTEHFETKYNGKSMTADNVFDAYLEEMTREPELIGEYESREEANKAWSQYRELVETTVIERTLVADVVYMEEVEQDGNGDPVFWEIVNWNAVPFHNVDDVIAELKDKNGSFVDDYCNEYVLLQQAYIEGIAENPYFTALAICWNDVRECGMYPVYEVTWNPTEEWLAGDREDEEDACDWENPIKIEKQTSGWDPEDGIIY